MDTEEGRPRSFPEAKFELLVRSYLDRLVDWEVLHQFAVAHIDDQYRPEFQRPVEDLHLMFLPEFRHDAESAHERPQITYLLDVWESLKQDVEKFGAEQVRQRELQRMASEPPSKHFYRNEHRERHRKRPGA